MVLDESGRTLVDKIAEAVLARGYRGRYAGQNRERNAWWGAAGEVVVAQGLGLEPPVAGAEPGRYDLQAPRGGVQVRARTRPDFDLMIAPEDRYHAQDPFVLVVPRDIEVLPGPIRFLIVGWILGSNAMIPRYWTGYRRHPLHGVVPHDAWAVPGVDLEDLVDLERLLGLPEPQLELF